MGTVVDVGTVIAKPIAWLSYSGNDFEREWNKGLGAVKEYCIV